MSYVQAAQIPSKIWFICEGAKSSRASVGTKSLGYQLVLAVTLGMNLSDPLGRRAMAFRVVLGLCLHTLLTKARSVFDFWKRG